METIKYTTTGTCSSLIEVEIENDIIENIIFYGGCNGNLKGISSLCRGMNIYDVIEKLKGIKCGSKPTSCPDQLALSLLNYLKSKGKTNKIKTV